MEWYTVNISALKHYDVKALCELFITLMIRNYVLYSDPKLPKGTHPQIA